MRQLTFASATTTALTKKHIYHVHCHYIKYVFVFVKKKRIYSDSVLRISWISDFKDHFSKESCQSRLAIFLLFLFSFIMRITRHDDVEDDDVATLAGGKMRFPFTVVATLASQDVSNQTRPTTERSWARQRNDNSNAWEYQQKTTTTGEYKWIYRPQQRVPVVPMWETKCFSFFLFTICRQFLFLFLHLLCSFHSYFYSS